VHTAQTAVPWRSRPTHALYVVNYLSNTVTELAASNLKILQVVPTAPIRSGSPTTAHGTSLGRGLHRRDTGLQHQAVVVGSFVDSGATDRRVLTRRWQ